MIAYLISQHFEAYFYSLLKDYLESRFLWFRNNAVMAATMTIDTLIFIPLAFWGDVPDSVISDVIIGQLIFKIAVGLMDTIFIYITHTAYEITPEEWKITLRLMKLVKIR